MKELGEVLGTLATTPVPTLLTAGGVLLLLLAVVGKIGTVELPEGRAKWALVLGASLLAGGVVLFALRPGSSSRAASPTTTAAAVVAEPAGEVELVPGGVTFAYAIPRGRSAPLAREDDAYHLRLEVPRGGETPWAGYCWDVRPVDISKHRELVVEFSSVGGAGPMEFKLEPSRIESCRSCAAWRTPPTGGRHVEVIPLQEYQYKYASAPAERFCLAINRDKGASRAEMSLRRVALR